MKNLHLKGNIKTDLAIFLMTRLPEWTKESRLEFAEEILSEVEMLIDQYSLYKEKGYINE